MSQSVPTFNQVNLIVTDIEAALAFYRLLGLEVSGGEAWIPGTMARHAEAAARMGVRLEFDNAAMARIWHPAAANLPKTVVGFGLPSRSEVDETYPRLTAAGYTGREAPYDAL